MQLIKWISWNFLVVIFMQTQELFTDYSEGVTMTMRFPNADIELFKFINSRDFSLLHVNLNNVSKLILF